MVVTRSRLDTKAVGVPKKIKFNDDDTMNDSDYDTAQENDAGDDHETSTLKREKSESESASDSDDAPEEESTSTARDKVITEKKRQEQLRRQVTEEKKNLRRLQDEHNKRQQELKRRRNQEEKEELPEFLPEDIMADIHRPSAEIKDKITPQPNNYKRFNDEDDIRAMKIAKLKALKKARTMPVEKGPVRVQVHVDSNKRYAPVAEQKIVGVRDKWLQRKSLKKK